MASREYRNGKQTAYTVGLKELAVAASKNGFDDHVNCRVWCTDGSSRSLTVSTKDLVYLGLFAAQDYESVRQRKEILGEVVEEDLEILEKDRLIEYEGREPRLSRGVDDLFVMVGEPSDLSSIADVSQLAFDTVKVEVSPVSEES